MFKRNRGSKFAVILVFVLLFQAHTTSAYAVDVTGEQNGFVTLNEDIKAKVTVSGGNEKAVNASGEHAFYNGESVSLRVSIIAVGKDLPVGTAVSVQLPQDFEIPENPENATNDIFFLNKISDDYIDIVTEEVIPAGVEKSFVAEGFNIFIEEGVKEGYQPITFEIKAGDASARCSTKIYALQHSDGIVPSDITLSLPVSTVAEFNVSFESAKSLAANGDMMQIWFPMAGNVPFRTIDAATGADVLGTVNGEPQSVGGVSYGEVAGSYVYTNIVLDGVTPELSFNGGTASFALRVDIANGNDGVPREVSIYVPGEKIEKNLSVGESSAEATPVLAAPADARAAEPDAAALMADASGTGITTASNSGARSGSRANPKTQDYSGGGVEARVLLCAGALLVLAGLVAARLRVRKCL